jgi:hypothetical protein
VRLPAATLPTNEEILSPPGPIGCTLSTPLARPTLSHRRPPSPNFPFLHATYPTQRLHRRNGVGESCKSFRCGGDLLDPPQRKKATIQLRMPMGIRPLRVQGLAAAKPTSRPRPKIPKIFRRPHARPILRYTNSIGGKALIRDPLLPEAGVPAIQIGS